MAEGRIRSARAIWKYCTDATVTSAPPTLR
jgi:hypothetical protein